MPSFAYRCIGLAWVGPSYSPLIQLAVACPAGSSGSPCACNAGLVGVVTWSSSTQSYASTCTGIQLYTVMDSFFCSSLSFSQILHIPLTSSWCLPCQLSGHTVRVLGSLQRHADVEQRNRDILRQLLRYSSFCYQPSSAVPVLI